MSDESIESSGLWDHINKINTATVPKNLSYKDMENMKDGLRQLKEVAFNPSIFRPQIHAGVKFFSQLNDEQLNNLLKNCEIITDGKGADYVEKRMEKL